MRKIRKEDGGPAFAVGYEIGGAPRGVTLRDYFAAKAMQSLLVDAAATDGKWHMEANAAYLIADAMLKARAE